VALDKLLSLGMLQMEQTTTLSTTAQTTPHLQPSLLLSQEPAIRTRAYLPPQPTTTTSKQITPQVQVENQIVPVLLHQQQQDSPSLRLLLLFGKVESVGICYGQKS